MPRILLVVDNSNIQVQIIKTFDHNARLSYYKLEKYFYDNDCFIAKQITGSTPPANDYFWERKKREGWETFACEKKSDFNGGKREKCVDTTIVGRATDAINNLKPDVLVLFSGDYDMKPLVEIAKEHSCVVHLWTFRESSSNELMDECDCVYFIDDYINDLIYFQIGQDCTETYAEHTERLAREERIRSEEWKARRKQATRERNESVSDNTSEGISVWKKAFLGIGAIAAIGIGCLISGCVNNTV